MTDSYGGVTKVYSGGTTVNGGLLRIAAYNNIGTGAITVNDGGTVEIVNGVLLDKFFNVNDGGVLKADSGADVTWSTATLASGATLAMGGTNVVYGTITAPSEGTATIRPFGTYELSKDTQRYTLANHFTGDVSKLVVDKTGMKDENNVSLPMDCIIVRLTTVTEGESTKLVLEAVKSGFYIYFR